MSNTEMPVSELMGAVVDGLRALVPTFERARLGWHEHDAYDPFEKIAESLLDGIIGSAIENGVFASPVFSVPKYGFTINSYSKLSYISDSKSGVPNAFIRFETSVEPFDTCLFAEIDREGKSLKTFQKKVIDVEFVFIPRGENGILLPQTSTLIFEN
ncbi:MAG: hypothetical protein PSY14_02075 [bacterium]|nr:hypothetical protein [bacterium]